LSRFDTILLGDNPFFGVDHLSHERGRQRSQNYKNFNNAIEIIKYSYDLGIKDMMIGTRPSLNEFLNNIRKNSNLIDKIDFHPLLPYAQDYVLKLSEKGLLETIKEVLGGGGLRNEIKIITKGGFGLLKKDLLELFKVFIDIEMMKLKNINIKTVYLHPLLTDLALSLEMKNFFGTFNEHLQDNYNVKVGLCTKNFPTLVSKLEEWKLQFSYIMTSFNKAGFLMNPSRIECEKTLSNYNGKVMAMNIFGGGYLDLDGASEYTLSLPKIRNIVVGASSIEHAKQTFDLFGKA